MEDFDFGNILYIVGVILFAIFGSRKKKKKPQTVPSDYSDKSENNISNIFENLISGNKYEERENSEYSVTQEQENYDFEQPVEPVIEKKPYSNLKANSYKNTPKNIVDRTTENADFVEETNTTSGDRLNSILGGEFDLRKAVLYSEILNRKSY